MILHTETVLWWTITTTIITGRLATAGISQRFMAIPMQWILGTIRSDTIRFMMITGTVDQVCI